MVIDCHGHYTTSPPQLATFRERQIEALADAGNARVKRALGISDDDIRESVESAQLRLQRERGTDCTLFSPHAAGMGHTSHSCNPNFHTAGAHNINGDTTVFMQLLQSDLFHDFPTLRFVIPHGGGAVQGTDPETGHAFDDTKRYIDAIEALPSADREKILHGNAARVYPRLARTIAGRSRGGSQSTMQREAGR